LVLSFYFVMLHYTKH